MGTRGRVVAVGHVIAGVDIAAWAVFATVVWPLADDAAPSRGPWWSIGDGDIDTVESFRGLHSDLTWASMLLAFGGLLLLARARARRAGLAVGTAIWVAANLALDILSVRGWTAAAAAAVVTAVGFLALLRPRTPVDEPPAGPGLVVYSAGALSAAAVLFLNDPVSSPLPGWADPAGLATVLLLVAAAVVVLVVAGATPQTAGVIGLATAGVVVAGYLGPSEETGPGRVVVALSLAAPLALPLATAGLLGLLPRGRAGVATAGALPVVGLAVVAISFFVTAGPLAMLGDRYDAYRSATGLALAGMAAGAVLTRLALLPRAYATGRSAHAPTTG